MSKYQSDAKYEFRQNIKPKIAPLTAAVTGALAAGSLQAAVITVDTLDDDFDTGKCSLRAALYSATSGLAHGDCEQGSAGNLNEIVFASSLSGTITMDASVATWGDGSFLAGSPVIIDGGGRITVKGDGSQPVFYSKYHPDESFNSESLTLKNLTITGGGGDYGAGVLSHSPKLVLDSVQIVNNLAGESGGGVWHEPFYGSGNLTIKDSVISGNDAAKGDGGGVGVYMASASGGITIHNSYFSNNKTLLGSGGGVHLDVDDFSNVYINNNYFVDNQTKYANGGAINAELGYARTYFGGNIFYANEARENGGGVFLSESLSNVKRAQVMFVSNYMVENRAGESGGGAFVDIRNGDYDQNDSPSKFVNFIGNEIFDNKSAHGGGGVFVNLDDSVTSLVRGTVFGFNQTEETGGGALRVEARDSSVYFENSAFGYNQAQTGRGGGAYITATGGDVYASGLYALANQSLAGTGGGMEVRANGSNFGMEFAGFYDNEASACGGGLRISGTPSGVGIDQSAFVDNSASCGGGAVLRRSAGDLAFLEIKNSEFSGNSATSSTGGGAIFAQFDDEPDTILFLKNSTLSGNMSAGSGSALGLFNHAQVEIKYSTLADNVAGNGGAAIRTHADVSCTISNSLFGNNRNGSNEQKDMAGPADCSVRRSLLQGAAGSNFVDNGGNILNVDPKIGPLQNNGGTGGFYGEGSYTHALLGGSPAIDAGSAGSFAPDYDQRGPGFSRIVGEAVDMGAFELQAGIFSDRFEKP